MNPDLYASLPPNKSPRGRSILNKIESELIKCCNDKLKWSCCIYSIGRAEYVDIVVYNIGPFHRAYIKFYNILWSMHWDWNEYHYSSTRITKLKGKELEWISENYEALEWGVKWAKKSREGRDNDLYNKNKKNCKNRSANTEEEILNQLEKVLK